MAYDHIKIQNSILKSGAFAELSPKSFKLYVALCNFYNWKDHISKVGAKKLSVTTGLGRASIFRAIKELKDRGLIVVERLEGLNPMGLNGYVIIDNLLYSLDHSKDPKEKHSIRMRLHSILKTLPGIKNETPVVSERHPNYIINNYVNIQDSFNKSKDTKDKEETPTQNKRWENRGEDTEKLIKEFLKK